MEKVTLFIFALSAVLAAVSGIGFLVFRRSDFSLFDPRFSTVSLMHDPEKFMRKPYARVVNAIGLTAFVLVGIAMLLHVVHIAVAE